MFLFLYFYHLLCVFLPGCFYLIFLCFVLFCLFVCLFFVEVTSSLPQVYSTTHISMICTEIYTCYTFKKEINKCLDIIIRVTTPPISKMFFQGKEKNTCTTIR